MAFSFLAQRHSTSDFPHFELICSYFKNCERFASEDYVPTVKDILNCKIKSDRVVEVLINSPPLFFGYDVLGSLSF
jgi:hypothetical protein